VAVQAHRRRLCAAFASARAAVDAAVDAQRLLGLPVRIGIASGEAEQRGDDYFGPALNCAARVMAVGHGGQILVSNSTAALVNKLNLLFDGRFHNACIVERKPSIDRRSMFAYPSIAVARAD
jgi:class 3 adenylate cyclase